MLDCKNITSLYVHIPFCKHICSYCDFTKLFYIEEYATKYIEQLFKEIDSYNLSQLKTIYVGGGTPTALNDHLFESLLKKLSVLLSDDYEFCVEANVENLSSSKLEIMKRYGVNRLSIGVQSSHDKILKLAGRMHNFADTKNVIALAKEYGFSNINVDLMFGFPGETINDLIADLNNIVSLDTNHISIYSLTIGKHTKFYNDNVKEQNSDESALFYETVVSFLREHGYKRYEVSNFAKPNFYSKHNTVYWKNQNYVGVGLGACGYIENIRYENTKNISKYLSGEYISEKEELSSNEIIEEYLLTNLRLEDGFLLSDFKNKFGKDFLEEYKDKIETLKKDNLVVIENDIFKVTDQGMLLLNRVLVTLL